MQFPVLFPRIGMPLRWKSKSKQKSCPDRTALFMCYEKKLISKKDMSELRVTILDEIISSKILKPFERLFYMFDNLVLVN